VNEKWELVDGHRRLAALKQNKATTVPVTPPGSTES
jgi:ParB-like chromosome segregation protein Spo0J